MEMKTLTVNGVTYQVTDANAVSFAKAQTLTADEKLQARQNLGMEEKTYELIEDITLEEDVTSFVRSNDPNGKAYDFSAVRICVSTAANPNAGSSAQLIFQLDDNKGDYIIYHQANGGIATGAKTSTLVARNDCGTVDYHVSTASGSNVGTLNTRPAHMIRTWRNVSKINITTNPSDVIIPAGTRIRIYAVRG